MTGNTIRIPLILDGAMGTQLNQRGLSQGVCPEKWILEHPETVREIQESYIAAGSEVIYAPTFGANRAALQKHGIVGMTAEYNRRLVALSREIAGGRALVAGDISSTGGMLYPMGNLRFEEMVDIYREQAAALEEAGVDLFVIETMTSVAEARAALLAVKEVSARPVFVTFTCDEAGRTMMGTDVCAALLIMQSMGADAFGLNCSTGPEEMAGQIRRLYPLALVPLIAKPNAGLPSVTDGKTVFDVSAAQFAGMVPLLIDAGASIIGGCCGTDADYIRGIREAFQTNAVKEVAPERVSGVVCSTEKDVFHLPDGAQLQAVFGCDDELEDQLCDLEEGLPFGIEIRSEEDAETLADLQYAIRNPLCIFCDDASLLEKALRVYQGRALYGGKLKPEERRLLAGKYGLI